MTDIAIRRFAPPDRDWLVDAHARIYAAEAGFDPSFGDLVGQIIDDFITSHDSVREAGWIAERAGQRLGSIFCVAQSEDTAKLRLFLLLPEARGTGLGKRMLDTCMGFAQAQGYAGMQLWTHESHRAACALYKAAGWELKTSAPVQNYGQHLVEQTWIYRF